MELYQAVRQLDELERRVSAYRYAISILHYDSETVAPQASVRGRSESLALLSEESYKLFYGKETGDLLSFLYQSLDQLDGAVRRRVEKLKEDYDKNFRIPMEEYVAFHVLTSESEVIWRTAKNTNDFRSFAPQLQKILDTLIRFARYINPDMNPYDVWLDEHEKGLTRLQCDAFFEEVKSTLVPLIHQVSLQPKPDCSFLENTVFPLEAQRALSLYLMDVMTIPHDRCILGEVEHPFSMGLNCNDVRMTTHYYKESLLSSLYSVIHEGGHSLYNLGVSPDFWDTCLAEPDSTSIHESQSRFFENYIGRSQEFLSFLLPKLQDLFPLVFSGVDARHLYAAVNRAQPSLIRIEADELTYSLHVMIRYEIEKMLFDHQISVDDLPDVWNRLYKEYLGVDVPDDSHGVLQDTHWAGGSFGYFPSYSLGSAYAAQIFCSMQKDLDIASLAGSGHLAPIVSWLKERIHTFGGVPTAQQVLLGASGVPFSPHFYLDYLTRKYSALYQLPLL